MTDHLLERIWAEVIDSSGCGHFCPTKMAESETLFIRADTAVTLAEADAMVGHIESRVGHWLSAALEDPNVCAEMKADVGRFFDATSDARAAFDRAVRESVEAERERCARIADSILDGEPSGLIRGCTTRNALKDAIAAAIRKDPSE